MNIDEIRSLLDNGIKTSSDLFLEAIKTAKNYQNEYNSFVTILEEKKEKESNSILSGVPYALKDNISTKNILTTASSNILKNYIPVYNATVYQKLVAAGAVLMGKTVLDELAMGGTGTTGHTGAVKNPWDKSRIIGGSSAGSASAVALGIVPFSIGSDTGDSVRKPAAFGGVVGFKPTYGRISRYGLFAFSSSLDHIGIFARTVKDITYVTDIVKGNDEHDMTSLKDDNKKYIDTINNDIKGRKLFYIKEVCNIDTDNIEIKETLTKFNEMIEKLKQIGFTIEEISMDKDLLNAIYPTYMAISCAEATSNNANLTGIHFGVRGKGNNIEEIMFNARTNGFSELIKRRFILGSYILQKENQEKLYLNSCRVRRMIVDKINELFKIYDGYILPAGSIAPKFGKEDEKLSDANLILENHLAIANFGGYPSITIPSGFVNNMPIAINLTGKIFEDDIVLNMANIIEEKLEYKNQIARGCDTNV